MEIFQYICNNSIRRITRKQKQNSSFLNEQTKKIERKKNEASGLEWLCAKLYRKLIPTAPRHVPRCPAPTLLLLPHDTVFGVETLQPTARRLKC